MEARDGVMQKRVRARDTERVDCESCSPYPTKTAPPLMFQISPEMKPAHGVQRKTMGPAISSGSAARPSGMRSSAFLDAIGSARVPADISVRTQPGATQLQRMPWGASSEERLLVSESSAPLLAA